MTPIAGIVISHFLGTSQIDYRVPSLTGLGDRHFATDADLTYEVTNARIWGGIHYRFSVDDGLAIAQHTAAYDVNRPFQRVHHRPCWPW